MNTKNNKPVITLKSIKVHHGLSQETHAYTATIYVDGKRFGTVENAGHGGCDNVHPDSRKYSDVRELDNRIKATYPKRKSEYFPEGREEDLEALCCDLVNTHNVRKEFRRLMGRKLVARKNGTSEIYEWNLKRKPIAPDFSKWAERFGDDYTLLNTMPPDKALEIFRGESATV